MATISATALPAGSPAPHIRVDVDSLAVGTTTLTLTRTVGRRDFKVRGAVRVPVSGGFSTLDVEAPFGVASTYRAEQFGADGLSLGFTPTAVATLEVGVAWIHNPLDPHGAVQIDIDDSSGRALTRVSSGEVLYPQNRTLGVLIAGPRRGLSGVELFLSTSSTVTADEFQDMLGGYSESDQTTPILCIRAPQTFTRLPPTFFAAVLELTEKPVTVHMGGQLIEYQASGEEVSPPYPGLVVPLLTRNDIDAFYATRNALDAAYAKRLDIDRDYSLAGTA